MAVVSDATTTSGAMNTGAAAIAMAIDMVTVTTGTNGGMIGMRREVGVRRELGVLGRCLSRLPLDSSACDL